MIRSRLDLPDAVRPDDADLGARVERDRDVLEDRAVRRVVPGEAVGRVDELGGHRSRVSPRRRRFVRRTRRRRPGVGTASVRLHRGAPPSPVTGRCGPASAQGLSLVTVTPGCASTGAVGAVVASRPTPATSTSANAIAATSPAAICRVPVNDLVDGDDAAMSSPPVAPAGLDPSRPWTGDLTPASSAPAGGRAIGRAARSRHAEFRRPRGVERPMGPSHAASAGGWTWAPRLVPLRQMRILVVGGGVAGLSMARALHLRGLDSEIVERDPAWRIAGAGVYIPGNGMAALDRLGLGDAVRARGAVVERRRLYDERGRIVHRLRRGGLLASRRAPGGAPPRRPARRPGRRRRGRADPVPDDRRRRSTTAATR